MIHVSCHVQKMLSVILITSSFRLRPPLSPPLQSSFKNVMDIDKRKNIIFTTCMHSKLSYKNIHFQSKNKLFTINRLFKYTILRKVLEHLRVVILIILIQTNIKFWYHIGTPPQQEARTK